MSNNIAEILTPIFTFKLDKTITLELGDWTMYDDMWCDAHCGGLNMLMHEVFLQPHPETKEVRSTVNNVLFMDTLIHKLTDESKSLIEDRKKDTESILEFISKRLTKKNGGAIATAFYAMLKSASLSEEDQKKTQDTAAMQMIK